MHSALSQSDWHNRHTMRPLRGTQLILLIWLVCTAQPRVADVALSGVLRGNVALAVGDHSGQAQPCTSDLQRVTCPRSLRAVLMESCTEHSVRHWSTLGQTLVKHLHAARALLWALLWLFIRTQVSTLWHPGHFSAQDRISHDSCHAGN